MITKSTRYVGVTGVVHVLSKGERVEKDQYSVVHRVSVINGRIKVSLDGKAPLEVVQNGAIELPAHAPHEIEGLEDNTVVLDLSEELQVIRCNPRHRTGKLGWPACPEK